MCGTPSAVLSPGLQARTLVRLLHILTDEGPFSVPAGSRLCFIQKRKDLFYGSDILWIFEERNATVTQGTATAHGGKHSQALFSFA